MTAEDLDVIDPTVLTREQRRTMELEVAGEWQKALQKELSIAAYVKSPEYLRVALPSAALVIILASAFHYKVRQTKLRRLGLAIWGLEIIVWGGAVVFLLWLFPVTKGLARSIQGGLVAPFFNLWLVILVTSLISHGIEGAICAFVQRLKQESDQRPRRVQRLETLASVACKTVRFLMVLVIVGFALSMLPFNFAPLVTGAGWWGFQSASLRKTFSKTFWRAFCCSSKTALG